MVLADMFLSVLEYNLKEIAYAADVAQLAYVWKFSFFLFSFASSKWSISLDKLSLIVYIWKLYKKYLSSYIKDVLALKILQLCFVICLGLKGISLVSKVI